MEYRKLGSSGMYISELAYGNWVTHGEQIDQDEATACVREALDLGITTFLIRGFDPLNDAIDYGKRLIPLTRQLVAEREHAQQVA